MKYLILIISIVFFTACSPRQYNFNINEKLENSYVSFNAPSKKWYAYNEKGYYPRNKNKIILHYDPKSTTYDINIETDPYRKSRVSFFNKNTDFKLRRKEFENSKSTKDIQKEQGVTYSKGEIQYINGMKCASSVFSRGFGGSLYSATSKNYSITCGYYDKSIKKHNGKRILRITYRYLYAGTTAQNKNNPTRLQIENNLKNEVKKLISTLKIKNFDKEKMIKEGLYHPSKKYENMKW